MRTGDVLKGRFELERLAEKGGMGAVYQARDLETNQPVALKVLHPYAMIEAPRMVREAHALMKLRHPGIVRYVHHGELDDERPYLAMEWLDGEDLRHCLKRRELRMSETVALGFRIAEALSHAHAAGIVHRDIKPSNLFLCGGQVSQVKIIDFGVARVPEPAREATSYGAVLGTIAYMAPEQARGSREVSSLADVFSLGCVLFECATGKRAFSGDDAMAVLAKVLVTELPRARQVNPNVPRELDRLLARMLAKDPSERPSAAEVARSLDGLTERTVSGGDTTSNALSQTGKTAALTGGERRVASVVLVRPALRLAGPEDITTSKTAMMSEVSRLARLFGPDAARVDRLVDGTVFAIVTGKTAAQDQALMAAQCALALRSEVSLGAMSLVTGSGEVSAGQWVGEALEVAAQLVRVEERRAEKESVPFSIRIDDVTAALLGGRAVIEKDVHGSRLVGLRSDEPIGRTLLGKPTPFVGRERELTLLQSTLTECAEEPVTRAVVVTAPPGGGKSRLLRELLSRVPPDFSVWIARGDPMRHKSPFGMLSQILRKLADLRDDEPASVQVEKLLSRVRRAEVDPSDEVRIAEFLGEIVGVAFPEDVSPKLRAARNDTMLMGDQMRRAWEDFVHAECEKQPILLVLEDLHWGDLPTAKLIDGLLRRRDLPLFVLALGRPNVLASFAGLFRSSHVMEVALPELSKRAGERLVREVLGKNAAPERVAHIVEHAGGNAFFLEELIRAEVEGRGEKVPGTVLAMVRTRLENMENDARRLLRAASVFGSSFWRAGVEALIGVESKSPDVSGWLAELLERELIVLHDDGRFAESEEYTFRHAIVREAAYAMLTDADRTLGHLLAAQWLVNVGERDAAALARHFELGGDLARAASFYLGAAEQALEGNDLDAALSCAERGIVCGAFGDERGGLKLIAAEVFRYRGEPALEQQAALEAMALLPRGGSKWYMAASQAAIASGKLGDRDRLESAASELIAEIVRANGAVTSVMTVAAARASIPLVLAGLRLPAEALLLHLETHADSAVLAEPAAAAWVHLARGTHAAEMGDCLPAVEHMTLSQTMFEEAGDVRGACAQSANIGWTSLEIGDVAGAELALTSGIERAQQLGLAHVVLNARIHLGLLLGRKGQFVEAESHVQEAIGGFVSGKNQRMEAIARRALAEVLYEANQLGRAEIEAQKSAALAANMAPIKAYSLATSARVLLRAGRVDSALEAAENAATLLDRQGQMVQGEACVRATLVEALSAANLTERARTALAEARNWLSERATRFPQGPLRDRFLNNVPDNKRLLSMDRIQAH
ncbi:MAG: protein kinase [Polyangiaceae bacterium]|nr:protein kinase [Polyangiaceae bacterium]